MKFGGGTVIRRASHCRRDVIVAAAFCVFAAVFAVSSTAAWATRGHVFSKSFGSEGAGPGQFVEPAGVAVNDATHDVYIVDKGNDRVERFDSEGHYLGQFDGSGQFEVVGASEPHKEGTPAPTGTLSFPRAIAIDNSCALHKPAPLTESTSPTCKESDESAGDVYVSDPGHAVIDKFTPQGEYIGQLTGAAGGAPFEELSGVSTDPSGNVWVFQGSGGSTQVDSFNNHETNEFLSSRAPIVPPGFGFISGGAFAVDATDNFYAVAESETRQSIGKFASDGVLTERAVGGELFVSEAFGGAAVDLATNDLYVDQHTSIAQYAPSGALLSRFAATEPGELIRGEGIGIDATDEAAYVADSEAGVVDIFLQQEPSRPVVEGESASGVTSETAGVEAEINPDSVSGEAGTEYYLQYGKCPPSPGACSAISFEASVPEALLAPSFNADAVGPVHLSGLSPDTVYHFRFVATSARGKVEGERNEKGEEIVHTFRTQAVGAFALPDSRAWELVSPPDKHGAEIEPLGQGHVTQASVEGGAVSYVANAPTESLPGGYSNLVQVLSTRGPEGWSSRDLAPPHAIATGAELTSAEYVLFSGDLSSGLLQPYGEFVPCESAQGVKQPCLSQDASEQTPFLHSNTSGTYRPLVTKENVPPATVFGEQGIQGGKCPFGAAATSAYNTCGPKFLGATPDLGHVILESTVALTGTSLPAGGAGLYEWSAGDTPSEQLQLVSALPGGGEQPAENHPELGFHSGGARNAIAQGGNRVFWTEKEGGMHLYMRDLVRKETVQLDAVQGGPGENPGKPVFQFASDDGTRVFFTDNQRLTPDSGGGEDKVDQKENDLYECEIFVEDEHLHCHLTDITPLHGGEEAHVQNLLPGGSEEGCDVGSGKECYVYFVANGVLAEGAVRGTCAGNDSLSGTRCNLYVARYDGAGWETKLVAVLSAGDYPDWNGKASESLVAGLTSRVSPDGRWLAFMSKLPLTGYDSRDVSSGERDEEVYLYDAVDGSISCASCNPSGARPAGVKFEKVLLGSYGEEQIWDETSVAGAVPTWTSYSQTEGLKALYQPRYLSDSGRLFFNSNDALVSDDANRTGDVYEFEPEGVGPQSAPCSPAVDSGSEVFKPARPFEVEGRKGAEAAGCVALISSGSSPEESFFLDASQSGGDVFFLTASKLLKQDFDTSYDVYDAHECTSESPCAGAAAGQLPECDNEASCKPAASPQPAIFGAPSSATFSGAGNPPSSPPSAAISKKQKTLTRSEKLSEALRTCRRDKAKKARVACEKRARKKYGAASKPKTKTKSHRGAK
jgi:DNA-binding beta-propeller fold protein YncE